MKKAFYTTPVTNVMEVETTGNILESSNRLGTGDRNNVGIDNQAVKVFVESCVK